MSETAVMFIDYDNIWITCKNIYGVRILEEDFIQKLKEFFREITLTEIIAYGNFDNGEMARDRHQTELQMKGIQTKHVMNGKDSADIAIVCDALEKLYLTGVKNDVFILVSCDRDITTLVHKIKAQGKRVILVTLAVNIDWDVMQNFGDQHCWFETIVGITFTIPQVKPELTEQTFLNELQLEIGKRDAAINYGLFSNTLQKKYKTNRSSIDGIKDKLLGQNTIEFYQYDFQGKTYNDGIKLVLDSVEV